VPGIGRRYSGEIKEVVALDFMRDALTGCEEGCEGTTWALSTPDSRRSQVGRRCAPLIRRSSGARIFSARRRTFSSRDVNDRAVTMSVCYQRVNTQTTGSASRAKQRMSGSLGPG